MPNPDLILRHIYESWALVQGAPAAAIALFVLGCFAASFWNSRRSGILKERCEALKDEVSRYKAKLDGATPEEAKARIEKLEATIKRTVGSEWKPLGYREIDALRKALEPIEKRRVQVMYQNAWGKTLAEAIAYAFENAGWDVDFSTGSGFEEGIFVGRSPTVSPLLKDAIERATTLQVICLPPLSALDRDGPDHSVFVAVGIKPE